MDCFSSFFVVVVYTFADEKKENKQNGWIASFYVCWGSKGEERSEKK
jgi:prolipoprotein diacylglyceryltransferase